MKVKTWEDPTENDDESKLSSSRDAGTNTEFDSRLLDEVDVMLMGFSGLDTTNSSWEDSATDEDEVMLGLRVSDTELDSGSGSNGSEDTVTDEDEVAFGISFSDSTNSEGADSETDEFKAKSEL